MHHHVKAVRLPLWTTLTLSVSVCNPCDYPEHAAIVVYDITKRRSFEEAKKFVDGLAQWVELCVFVALVGNKVDFEFSREVSFQVSNVIMFA